MADTGPQKPGESDSEYVRRLMRASQEQQRQKRDDRTEKRLQEEAADARWEMEIAAELGGDFIEQVADIATADYIDPKVRKAAQEYQKAARKGQSSKAKRIAKRNKGAFKKAAKEVNKKKKGCLWAAVALFSLGISATGGIGWGVYEGVTSLIG